MSEHKFSYRWKLADANFTKDKGKVFSCFACGGGSYMGYKLAGFDVIGCNEIDERMMYLYKLNHNPKYAFLEPIQTFKDRNDLPEELYNLDILDGSPPCSTFSIAGDREKSWGKMKRFKEGQAKQVLDTLFFDFIDLAKKLQPKVVIAENVKGLVIGKAKDYLKRIYQSFDEAGYYVNHYLLDAKTMGVPQRRQRVFFVCLRKDLVKFVPSVQNLFETTPYLDMTFNEEEIPFKDVADGLGDEVNSPKIRQCWDFRKDGDNALSKAYMRLFGKDFLFNMKYVYPENVCPTLAARKVCLIRFDIPKYLSATEATLISTFPLDYDFAGKQPHYICGMSVPPVMMAQVASRVYEQWLSNI